MKCCGKVMYDNGDNYRCGVCGKRIKIIKKVDTCPYCSAQLYDNGDNVHCAKCGYRRRINKYKEKFDH